MQLCDMDREVSCSRFSSHFAMEKLFGSVM